MGWEMPWYSAQDLLDTLLVGRRIGMFHLIGPLLLVALGVALLFRRPRRCRGDWRARNDGGSKAAPQSPSAGLP